MRLSRTSSVCFAILLAHPRCARGDCEAYCEHWTFTVADKCTYSSCDTCDVCFPPSPSSPPSPSAPPSAPPPAAPLVGLTHVGSTSGFVVEASGEVATFAEVATFERGSSTYAIGGFGPARAGAWVVDVSDPARPAMMSNVTDEALGWLQGVATFSRGNSSTYAIATIRHSDDNGKVALIDVTSPAHAALVSVVASKP